MSCNYKNVNSNKLAATNSQFEGDGKKRMQSCETKLIGEMHRMDGVMSKKVREAHQGSRGAQGQ